MHITMIGPFGMQPRGTMRVRALPLARALVQHSHQVDLLLPPWQNPEHTGKMWQDAGVRVENMQLPLHLPGWFHFWLTATLVRRAKALKPDVVHIFKPKAFAGLAHIALARYIPSVVDTDDWEGTGGWNDLNPYSPALKRFFAWQEQWGLRRANAVTVASMALQTLVWAVGRAPESVFYMPNGVVAPAYAGSTIEKTGRPTVLLYTRFFEFGLDRLWRILSDVRKKVPAIQFLVVGKGFFGEEQMLVDKAVAAGWRVSQRPNLTPEDDLVYTGLGTADTLPGYFQQADIAIYPFDDTLLNRTKCPVKLLDLLAAGVPVVADAVGQISEMVRDGVSGLLVPTGHDDAFVSAIVKLVGDPALCHAMSDRASQDMQKRFSWDRMADVAEQAYVFARAKH
ncbi:MAG: glycosyltransferase family 4 protein [Anaerolineae bacterium]|nr:glycosyltransferase family 4 protein [Anaerolineae bacterium]